MHEIEMFRILEGATAFYETLVVYQFVSGLFVQKKQFNTSIGSICAFGLNLSLLSVYVRTSNNSNLFYIDCPIWN